MTTALTSYTTSGDVTGGNVAHASAAPERRDVQDMAFTVGLTVIAIVVAPAFAQGGCDLGEFNLETEGATWRRQVEERYPTHGTPILPPDYPARLLLADEVHPRPPEALGRSSRATYVAVLIDHEQRANEAAYLAGFCAQFGVAPPMADTSQFRADLGAVRLKWERHGEFSSYTFFTAGRNPTPFSEPPDAMLPAVWIAKLPGATIFAAHASSSHPTQRRRIQNSCRSRSCAGLAFTDFRIHGDGVRHFWLLDRSFTRRQDGRMMQRLLEIETDRMMALLALPVAQEQSRRIVAIEHSLAALTDDIAKDGADDEALLTQLSRLAADVARVWLGARSALAQPTRCDLKFGSLQESESVRFNLTMRFRGTGPISAGRCCHEQLI